jgi:hypothetical protein
MDAQSRRLLQFSESPDPAGLSVRLATLDSRRPVDVQEAGVLARGAGLTLVAWQLGDSLARLGGSAADREAAKIQLLRERALLTARLADSLAAELLLDKSIALYARAAGDARALAAAAPADPDAASLQAGAAARGLEAKSAVARKKEVAVVMAAASVLRTDPREPVLMLQLVVHNWRDVRVSRVGVHAAFPTADAGPGLASIDSLAPGESREVEIILRPGGAWSPGAAPALPLAVLVTWEAGTEVISSWTMLSVGLSDTPGPRERARRLGAGAPVQDVLLAGLTRTRALGAGGTETVARDSFAGVLDSLCALRSRESAVAPGDIPPVAPGDIPPVAESTDSDSRSPSLAVRTALRGLGPAEHPWAVLAASLAGSLGLRSGLITWESGTCALVDTGLPLQATVDRVPGLVRYSGLLAALSRDGRLCLPVSGRIAPTKAEPMAWAIADGLVTCATFGTEKAGIAWVDQESVAAGPVTPVPAAFPLALPARASSMTMDGVLAALTSLLDSQP